MALSEHVLQAAQFDKWAKAEQQRVFEEHAQPTPTGGKHATYPPEVGRRLGALRSARHHLEDFASMEAHHKIAYGKSIGILDQPLRDLLPEQHHQIIEDWEKSR